MPSNPAPQHDAAKPGAAAPDPPHRWLLFVHQLPAAPSNLRVRTWRRLQELGAIPVKQAVYVLPDTPSTREDFEWLTTEVRSAGGDVTVFAASSVDLWADAAIVEEFRRTRQEAYAALAGEIEQVLRRASTTRRPRGTRAPAVQRLAEGFGQRLSALEHMDFFGSAGRDRVVTLLTELQNRARSPGGKPTSAAQPGTADPTQYRQRLWITRPRPGVDRMASAWLIRRLIDPEARFGFAPDRDALPAETAVPFDMFGVEFSHQGDACTFETLCAVFGIEDPAASRIAAIVHDLDLKDGRFGASDAPTVGSVIEGLQLAIGNDHDLLERGITLFDALYRAFAQSSRIGGPRPVAKSRTSVQKGRRSTRRG